MGGSAVGSKTHKRKNKNIVRGVAIRFWGVGGFMSVAVLGLLGISLFSASLSSFSHSVYAESSASSNTVNISVESGCIISASGNHHAGSITPSTYGQIGGEGSNTTVTIGCNDGNGYTVYAVGYTNDVEGTTELIGKKTSASSGNNKITTGTAQSGEVSNWNFKLSEPTGLTLTSTYTNNSSIPDSSTAVATKKASTDPTGYIDSFKAAYFAYISSTQPADTYSGKVKYTVFHNAELIYNYTIHYNLDDGQGGPDPNPQTGKSNTGSVQLSGTEPTKQDYKFMGWCSVQPTGNNTENPTCGGQTYAAGQDYTLSEIDTNTTLYAMWKADLKSYSITYNQGKVICGDSTMSHFTLPSPNPQTGTTVSSTVNLSSLTPTYSGPYGTHDFQYWCSVEPSNYDTCSGQTYSPGDPYPLNSPTTNVTLWAIWTYPSGGLAVPC